ncbi:MAG: IS200/IS605 family transposase [Ignavibacteria bacterium]|nr:IS200/IS605 family transposase [Ignavibacteria bacterium]
MSHSNVKIWIHLLFSTKDRQPLIDSNIEERLYNHIERKLITEYDCVVESINGYNDHIHILLSLSEKHSLENVVKNIKGESSHWINQNNLLKKKFCWQSGYCAFSISINKVGIVKKYIENQKLHHKKSTFVEEYGILKQIYGMDK